MYIINLTSCCCPPCPPPVSPSPPPWPPSPSPACSNTTIPDPLPHPSPPLLPQLAPQVLSVLKARKRYVSWNWVCPCLPDWCLFEALLDSSSTSRKSALLFIITSFPLPPPASCKARGSWSCRGSSGSHPAPSSSHRRSCRRLYRSRSRSVTEDMMKMCGGRLMPTRPLPGWWWWSRWWWWWWRWWWWRWWWWRCIDDDDDDDDDYDDDNGSWRIPTLPFPWLQRRMSKW